MKEIRKRRPLDEYCMGMKRPNKESKEWLKKEFGNVDWEVLEDGKIVAQSRDKKRLMKLID